jgi:sortase (surface protein transpeptidase)
VIPKIELDTTFVPPLGLNPDKTVSVPDNYIQVGWYSGGATPGEVGPSVILGHVDSFEGPAVFYKLGKLEAGDEVTITRADGTIAVFEVIDTERYSQDAFPTEKVYGPIDFAGLRLITCTGTFNKAEQKYSHNTVVYAKLKE